MSDALLNDDSLKQALRKLYVPTGERCGFVLKDGSVVECRNVSEDPSKDVFVAHPDDIERYCDDVAATWHTHPATSKHDATLSADDWSMFVQWPEDVVHFIVGAMTIRGYRVRKGAVIDS